MEIVLLQDVKSLGKANTIVKVKDGYARNYLFPKNLAVIATPFNLKKVEEEKEKNIKLKQRQKQAATDLSSRLSSMSITIPVTVHDDDKMYGSITVTHIIEALKQEGITEISKDAIMLDEPIKSTGVYEVAVYLYPEITSHLKVWVVKK